ncbi:MAG TPA: PKD domain-containing protein [Ferruginibacter sp.]|nr:PKD domain-containing protein [Ferruginibacter sp.]
MKRIFTLLLVLTAFFSADVLAQCNPEFTFTVNNANGQVQFTPVNTNAVQHTWLFGDGSSSNVAAPVHVYFPGTYSVVHVVTFHSPNDSSLQCSDSSQRLLTITGQQPCNIDADFSFVRDSVQTNKVYFTNLSTGVDSNTVTQWIFGDGTSSFDDNPVHVFPSSGVYRVCLAVRRDNICADDTCAMVQVQAPQCNIQVNFSSQVDSIDPNTINFTNLTTPMEPTDSVTWLFGDGLSSAEINPSHSYISGGTYTVCLVVKRYTAAGVTCIREFCQSVTIAPFCNIIPNFVYYRDSSTSQPATYLFYNGTVPFSPADSSFWDFGDGSPLVFSNNALTHTYTNPGYYTVCLRVKKMQPGTTNAICERQVCQSILVDTPQVQCNLQAFFTAQRDSSSFNSFSFTNLTQGLTAVDSVRWTFGDGTSSNVFNPVHSYNLAGTYQVCLRVKRTQVPGAAPCVDEYCQSVLVQQPNTCNLVVNFDDSVINNTVFFTNYSTPLTAADSVRWTFGDGSTSTELNPVHTYNQPGSYSVCLIIRKAQTNTSAPCVRELCRMVTIQPQPCNIVVNFTAERDSLPTNPGSTFVFTNTTTGLSTIDSSFWSFGDGTPVEYASSTTLTHTYTGVGAFNVCLVVKKIIPGTNTVACVREFCRTIVVQQTNTCNLVADFTYLSDSVNGGPGNIYQFTNTSVPLTGADSSFWNFGDGSPIEMSITGATHTYANPGTYTVCLLVKKAIPGSINILCERQVCKTIVVTGQPDVCDQLLVDFSWRTDSANNRVIHFINQTNPLTANVFINWSFGDGSNSTAFSPEHQYAQPGTYTVCLRAQLANCIKDTCQVIVVQPSIVDSCTIQPVFVTRLDSANRRKVYFVNTTGSATTTGNAVWNFGDGSSSNTWNAVHEYAMPGRYGVCLTVTQGNICTRTYCDSIFVPGNVIPPVNCDSFRLEFGYRRDDYMPNKLFFFATGNAPFYNQHWSFTPVNGGTAFTVNQNNPVYVFPDTGLYRVCVRGAFSTNCVKEYCDEVRIFSTSTPAQCMLTAYPNPAHNLVSFNVQLDAPGIVSSTVFNMQGMPMMQFTQTGVTGNNLVALGIQNLVPGFYTVRVMYNGRVCFTRFQKI